MPIAFKKKKKKKSEVTKPGYDGQRTLEGV